MNGRDDIEAISRRHSIANFMPKKIIKKLEEKAKSGCAYNRTPFFVELFDGALFRRVRSPLQMSAESASDESSGEELVSDLLPDQPADEPDHLEPNRGDGPPHPHFLQEKRRTLFTLHHSLPPRNRSDKRRNSKESVTKPNRSAKELTKMGNETLHNEADVTPVTANSPTGSKAIIGYRRSIISPRTVKINV